MPGGSDSKTRPKVLLLLSVPLLAILGIVAYLGRGFLERGPLASGEEAYRLGAWKEAALKAQKVLKSDPESPDARALLARSQARLGHAEAARNLYSQLDPRNLEAEDFLVVSLGLIAEGKVEDGVLGLKNALERDPNHAESLAELIRINRLSDRMNEAGEFARRLASVPNHKAQGHVALGLIQRQTKDPLAASESFLRALEIDPSLKGVKEGSPDQVRNWRVRALLEAGQADRARSELEALLKVTPDDRERNWLLSRAALQQHDLVTAASALAASRGFNADHPEEREPAVYVGAARCGECHDRIYRDQRASRHAETFHRGSDMAALKLPERPQADPGRPDVTHNVARQGQDLVYTAQGPDSKLQAVIQFILGSGDRAMTLVGRDDKKDWHELRMTRYGSDSSWDLTPGQNPTPHSVHEFLGKRQDADMLRRCLGCHTTRASISPATGELVEADERGFSCERCHGPAGNHFAAVDGKFSDPAIARPRLATAKAVNAICGDCHSAEGRGIGPEDPDLARFQVTALGLSRCSSMSAEPMSCLACHSPHRNAETAPSSYESKCLECHSGRESVQGVASKPCPVNATTGCIGCHMPRRQTSVPRTTFTDHRIRVIRNPDSSVSMHAKSIGLSAPGHSSSGPGTAP